MPEHATAPHLADIADSFAEHRRFLHNLASMQLNSRDEAEDAVQDTFAAAISGMAGFSGRVPVRAWLVGILRNKIIDAIRRRARYIRLDPADGLPDDDAEFDGMFTPDGSWQPAALHGACPESAAAYQQLLELVDLCMQQLPANTGRVFLMREFLGLEFTDIARQLDLSEGHLRVLLYRARMRLRDCVSRGWEHA
jgi:RNA polymerase sigma-70 factor (ECF subfamily)